MPTALIIHGWRLFFYMNERNEPPHIHARKGDTDCKFWLKVDEYEIEEVYGYNLSQRNRRQIRKIIFENFDYLVEAYQRVHGDDNE
ncbi:MAG: DUF4160 domain-containing protein [Caldilineaceae bacterium]